MWIGLLCQKLCLEKRIFANNYFPKFRARLHIVYIIPNIFRATGGVLGEPGFRMYHCYVVLGGCNSIKPFLGILSSGGSIFLSLPISYPFVPNLSLLASGKDHFI